ncbi:MAG: hypothetical protein DI498_05575 [Paracoccus denitrificans]|nr:MAG: hypothetical protein DI498_05575 [Paracoccus denitrificans]PZO84903.1 MAG: hypothetical protein DI633_05575 [Paracoccus denitrificans]
MSGVFGTTAPRVPRPGEIADDAADVLASIRRLIAQDEGRQKPAEAAPVPHLRAVEPTLPPPLRLEPETLVPPVDLPRHLTESVPASTPAPQSSESESTMPAPSAPTCDMSDWTNLTVTPAPSAAPQIFLVEDAVLGADSTTSVDAATDAADTARAPQPAQAAPSGSEPTLSVMTQVAPSPARNLFAPQGDTLTRDIRQAIRDELQGELGERLTGHLRAMIAEEVARARDLTKGSISAC